MFTAHAMTSLCERSSRITTVLAILFVAMGMLPTSVSQSMISNVTILSVSSISGCIDSYPIVTNCTFPASISIRTSGIDTRMDPTSLSLLITSQQVEIWIWLLSLRSDDMTIVATVTSVPYNPTLFHGRANLSVYDYGTGIRSVPFPGISFAYDGPPTLLTIGGCRGAGAGTYDCVPASDVVTFTGSGFRWLTNRAYVSVQIGNNGVYAGQAFQVVNDSYALLLLNTTYTYLLLPQHYSGVVLPVSIFLPSSGSTTVLARYYTNALSVSFITLPAPIVISIVADATCQNLTLSGGSTFYFTCIPGVSYLVVSGHYLYSDAITVGGSPCSKQNTRVNGGTAANAPLLYCTLPEILDTEPGRSYNVVVSNAAGTYVPDISVAYTAQPSISAITPCEDHALAGLGSWCQPGALLTISGSRLYVDTSVTVLLVSSRPLEINVTCPQPTVVNSSTITCLLPELDSISAAQFYGRSVRLLVLFNFSTVVTNTLVRTVYNLPGAPYIASISGCDLSVSARDVSSCHSGGILTLSGHNFSGSSISIYSITSQPYFSCFLLPGNSSTMVTCRLPLFDPVDAPFVADNPYTLIMSIVTLSSRPTVVASNTFTVSFTYPPVTPSGSQTEKSIAASPTIILLSTIVPVLGVLIVGTLAFMRYRRRKRDQHLLDLSTEQELM